MARLWIIDCNLSCRNANHPGQSYPDVVCPPDCLTQC